MNEDLNVVYEIRDAVPEDKSFIMATWLKGLYYGDSWFSSIPKSIFMNNYKLILEAILAKHLVKVACLKEDSNVIIGYSILSNDYTTIHWVFVKQAFRNKGVGRSLVPQYPTNVSHLTTLGKSLLAKIPNCVFNPWAL